MNRFLRPLFTLLFALFCLAYPLAVTGVAFDVHPPFSLARAGSALLLLEGTLLMVAAMLMYGWRRGFCAGLIVMAVSYFVEAIGVLTGFPFGVSHYTTILSPRLPGSVPLAVLFAWVLIVFGVYGWVHVEKYRLNIRRALLGALLATLLDVEIEPVAAHLEHYWEWHPIVKNALIGLLVTYLSVSFALTGLLDRCSSKSSLACLWLPGDSPTVSAATGTPIRALAGMKRPRCLRRHRGLLGPFLVTGFIAG
jgi:hypothetical protein